MIFNNHLINIKYPSKEERKKELWDVEGILKKRSNQRLKFDLRPMSKYKNSMYGKTGSISTKADKMVFEIGYNWIIVDIKELHAHLIKNKTKKVYLEELISSLDWNIVLPKN